MVDAVLVSEMTYMPAETRWYRCADGKHLLVTKLAGDVVGAGETLLFWSDEHGSPCDEHGALLSSLDPWQRFSDGPDFDAALERVGYVLAEVSG